MKKIFNKTYDSICDAGLFYFGVSLIPKYLAKKKALKLTDTEMGSHPPQTGTFGLIAPVMEATINLYQKNPDA